MPSEHRGSREICRGSAGSVERALFELFEGHVLERILMGGTGTTGGATSASSASFQRVAYGHQRLQAGEADLRHRRAEIVPAGFAEGKELFRDFDADHAERRNARESPSNRRLAIEPRPRLLKLPGQAEERRLVAVARNELN